MRASWPLCRGKWGEQKTNSRKAVADYRHHLRQGNENRAIKTGKKEVEMRKVPTCGRVSRRA